MIPGMRFTFGMWLLLLGSLGTKSVSAQEEASTPRWFWPVERRAIEPRLILGGSLTFQGPQVVSSEFEQASGVPWFGVDLAAGSSFTVHDRWGFEVLGSFAYQSNMIWIDSLCFPVFLPNYRTELRTWRLLPWLDWDDWELKVALAAGWSFQSSGTKEREDDGYRTVTRYEAMTRPYVAPEVGIWRWNALDRDEFAVRFVAHLDGTSAFTSTVTHSTGTAVLIGTQDNLAFIYRHHFGMPKRVPHGPRPTTEYDARDTETLLALATHRSGVPLVLWDDAEQDGDTISVLLNGKVVLDHFGLSRKRHRIYLPLDWGDNTILVVAHNVGRIPPNTARATIRTGRRKSQLLVKTSPTQNVAVTVRYQ